MCTNRVFVVKLTKSMLWKGDDGGNSEKYDTCLIISLKWRTLLRETATYMDLSELQAIYSLHIKCTNTLVTGGLGWKRWIVGCVHKNECH